MERVRLCGGWATKSARSDLGARATTALIVIAEMGLQAAAEEKKLATSRQRHALVLVEGCVLSVLSA